MRRILVFHHDQRGNVLMLTGLAILFLFAVAGAGVDFGRQQLVRMKLQNASDAAAVAAASLPDSSSVEQRRQVALRYFNLNFPSEYLGIARPTPNIQIGNQITVDASTAFNANFVSNVGVERLEAQGRTVVDRAAKQTASIYDVILVMDNSGSMANYAAAPAYAFTPVGDRNNARATILPICQNEWRMQFVELCKYREFYISYGNSANCTLNWARDHCNAHTNGQIASGQNGFSFVDNTRLNALRSVALNFVTRIIDEGEVGSRIGLVAYDSEVRINRPLNTNAASVRQAINQMGAVGATNPFGAMQAANTMGANFALNHVKAVVLLTDGEPTTTGGVRNYTYNPRTNDASARDGDGCNGSTFCTPAVNKTLPICTQLKNNGVQVYTIAFGPEANSSNVQNFLRSCASVDGDGNPRFYNAPSGAQLDAAFTQILTSLGKIRIAQ